MTRIGPRISRAELGAVICAALESLGDRPVLVGGAAVSIYTEGRYVSYDLDFVTYRDAKQYGPLLSALGFARRGSHWIHPATELYLQFVNPPPMVGRKYIRAADRLQTARGELRLLSPLDCACDRLAWFLTGDSESLEQCVDVIVAQRVDLRRVAAWLAAEPWPPSERKLALETLRGRVAARRKDAAAKRRRR